MDVRSAATSPAIATAQNLPPSATQLTLARLGVDAAIVPTPDNNWGKWLR